MRLSLSLFLCLSPLTAFAQDVDCANQVTQIDMNQCAYQEFEAADAALNRVYAEAIAFLQASDREYPPAGESEEARLRRAQRAWVAYRDANCDQAGFQMRGGSAEPLLVNGCLRFMTEARIAELRSVMQTY
ncbi:MAG: lysozyme inhibitor LprI family protein [Rhodobacteraceae bacterium]|jgi:uncharacterized protein YecT (DUF1311 family)|nr:lysozyme inhibitor LprI family protein [Paracoccaceae bacterium]